MAVNTRHKDADWELPTTDEGRIKSWDYVQIAVLMDIRDELQRLNSLLHCHNFQQIPHTLKRIDRRLSTTRKLTRGKKQ
jgi:hypothetical protein